MLILDIPGREEHFCSRRYTTLILCLNIIVPVTLYEFDYVPSRLRSGQPPGDVTLSSPYIRTVVSVLIQMVWFRPG